MKSKMGISIFFDTTKGELTFTFIPADFGGKCAEDLIVPKFAKDINGNFVRAIGSEETIKLVKALVKNL
jgi:hypothetical protein